MARPGVDFESVGAAALRLFERGDVVTVDSVRAELGGTGSKSTLAPLVKRWKTEHSQSVERSLNALPADLVAAVQRLHGDLQQQFNDRLQRAETAAETRVAELTALNAEHVRSIEAMKYESAQLASALSSLQLELTAAKERHADSNASANELRIRHETLAEISAATTAENGRLRELVEQGRRQFEHFQEAAQLRWDAERTRGEEKLAQAKAEYAELQTALQQDRQQAMVIQGRLEQLVPEYERLTQEIESQRAENSRLNLCASRLQVEIERKTALCTQLEEREHERVLKLAEADTLLAACHSRTELLSHQVAVGDERLHIANAEIARISGLYAETKNELRHCQERMRLPETPSRGQDK